MFFNKKPTNITKVKMDKVDEDLMNKEIFSADEARKMGEEAIIQKRNNNRLQIFRSIKISIGNGYKNSNQLISTLFEDGNDIYFEGLGFKLTRHWVDQFGQTFTMKPEPLAPGTSVTPPPSYTKGTSGWGGSTYTYYPP